MILVTFWNKKSMNTLKPVAQQIMPGIENIFCVFVMDTDKKCIVAPKMRLGILSQHMQKFIIIICFLPDISTAAEAFWLKVPLKRSP